MAVDIHRFHRLLTQARTGTGESDTANLLGEALELWRGDAFSSLDSPWLNTVREDLNRQRRAAELDHNDLAIARGEHHALLPSLAASAAAHPLDERLAEQLMLALYRCGRQADALAHSGLVAAEGAHPLSLDLLTTDESRDMLIRRLGHARILAEAQAVEEIITRCARLPLALSIVAARAATHVDFPLTALAAELHDSGERLDALAGGDPAAMCGRCSPGPISGSPPTRRGCSGFSGCTPARTSPPPRRPASPAYPHRRCDHC
jgi:hypothetical protein